ncbi:MAG TPA: 3-deoxy-D-manno-octulosonic acid transferase [Desulfobacteraceae bacterium]|nr:3-deoxy-D-manno-octulosonic acid transferase [Desulfobacteraceae bacterium]
MTKCAFIPNFLGFYNILWLLALPFLKRNQRLAHSFERRTGWRHFEPADIWLQAASAGEAFLAVSILKTLKPKDPVRVLVTTTTDQGMEILDNGLANGRLHPNIRLTLELFPFDIPRTMNKAVEHIAPKVMVLLETELWPALLHALKTRGTKILILNARMSSKSGRHYRATRFLWRHLAPDRILATSCVDVERWAGVFPESDISPMENIKFDIMDTNTEQADASDISALVPSNLPLSIIASLRRQEEPELAALLKQLQSAVPEQIIAVFPRHMHRIIPVSRLLKKHRIPFILRSKLSSRVSAPAIILWDRFGELRKAYSLADAVFVGGSLRPLGGQNFIEPAVLGVPTVTGPFWDDFIWVGKDIFEKGIITRCKTTEDVATAMIGHLKNKSDTTGRQKKVLDYIRTHRGGSKTACREILSALKN